MTKLEIDAFLAIVEHGSISATAEQIFVTQSALSRRIQALEKKLGYRLFERDKGMRAIVLTEQGKAFLSVAKKWTSIYQEAQAIRTINQKPVLHLASISGVSAYILPDILQIIAADDYPYHLDYHSCHSWEGHSLVENGFSDIALVEYSKKTIGQQGSIISTPVFSTPFVLLGSSFWKGQQNIHPSTLDPKKEIRLPWNSSFELWHEYWFDTAVYPKVRLDQVMAIKDVVREDLFSIVPKYVGIQIARTVPGIVLCELEEGPPNEIVHCLTSVVSHRKPQVLNFMSLLKSSVQANKELQCLL